MASKNDIIRTVLEYVQDHDDRYAIMMMGDWGCGKTWLVDHDVRRALSHKGWSLVRVSLFGIRTVEELNARIVTSRAREFLPKTESTKDSSRDSQLSGGWLAGTLLDNIQNTLKDRTGISFNLTTGLLASTFTWTKTLLVLDDLERRSSESDNELFGHINNMVEGQRVKVLFLCNLEEDKGVAKAFDKLIWRRVHYVPDMGEHVELMLDRIEGKFPAELCVRQRIIAALDATHCQNIRELWKLRRMVQALLSSGFSSDESIPPYSRASMIEDTLRLCLKYSAQAGEKKPQEHNQHADQTEFEGKAIPTMESLLARGDMALLESMPFIRDYYDDGTPLDQETMRQILSELALQRYPYSTVCQEALEADQRFRTLNVEDSDARSIAASIESAFGAEDIPLASLPRMVSTLAALRDIGIIGDENVRHCLSHAEAMLQSSPLEAKRAIACDPVSWQVGIPESFDEHVIEIDGLRQFVEQLVADEQDLNRELSLYMNPDQENACTALAEKLRSYNDSKFLEWSYVEVPPRVVARCVQTSNAESICCLRAAMTVLFRNPKPWNERDISECARWSRAVAEELDGIEIESLMRRHHAERLRDCLVKESEELFAQLPSESA